MCGRYTLDTTMGALTRLLGELAGGSVPLQRFNAAPTDTLPIVQRRGGRPTLLSARWGMSLGSGDRRVINARSESVATKPLFRPLLSSGRCLVPASGFFEWKTTKRGKQPYLFRPADDELFAYAGLLRADPKDGPPEFVVLTTVPNEVVAPIHNRMPLILDAPGRAAWLDSEVALDPMGADWARPWPAERMTHFPVTTALNRAGHQVRPEPVPERPADPQLGLL